jgi:hypothetical protein
MSSHLKKLGRLDFFIVEPYKAICCAKNRILAILRRMIW